jgi:thymidine phosphorylase
MLNTQESNVRMFQQAYTIDVLNPLPQKSLRSQPPSSIMPQYVNGSVIFGQPAAKLNPADAANIRTRYFIIAYGNRYLLIEVGITFAVSFTESGVSCHWQA